MTRAPETSTTLLRDVASEADNARREEFVARYRPMMRTYLAVHFPALEADDIVQECFGAAALSLRSGRDGAFQELSDRHSPQQGAEALRTAGARIRREVALLADAKGVGFPRFHGAGEDGGVSYLAMEFLEPFELPASDRAVAGFVLDVCATIAALHRRGYVHRDIKPANVMRRRRRRN